MRYCAAFCLVEFFLWYANSPQSTLSPVEGLLTTGVSADSTALSSRSRSSVATRHSMMIGMSAPMKDAIFRVERIVVIEMRSWCPAASISL